MNRSRFAPFLLPLVLGLFGCDKPTDDDQPDTVLLIAKQADGRRIPHVDVSFSSARYQGHKRTDSKGAAVLFLTYTWPEKVAAQVEGCPAEASFSKGTGLYDFDLVVTVITETWDACRDPRSANVWGPGGHVVGFHATFTRWFPYPTPSWTGTGGDSLRLDLTGKGRLRWNALLHPFQEETVYKLFVDGIVLQRPQYSLSPSDTTFRILWPPTPMAQVAKWSWPLRCDRTMFFVNDAILFEESIDAPGNRATWGRVQHGDSIVRIESDLTGMRTWRIHPLRFTENGVKVDTGSGHPMYCATQAPAD